MLNKNDRDQLNGHIHKLIDLRIRYYEHGMAVEKAEKELNHFLDLQESAKDVKGKVSNQDY